VPHPVDRVAHWAGIIVQWKDSGLSKAEFCRRHGLALASLKNWFYTPRYRDAVERYLAGQVEPVGTPTAAPPRLVPVVVGSDDEPADEPQPAPSAISPEPPLQVILAAGLRIAVGPGFDPVTLRRLVEALGPSR
jgi:lambda repressor-like predicted transcriptional regulator